jgi:protein TonB
MKLDSVVAASKDTDQLFSLGDLDQKPRVIYQPGPTLTPALRRAGGGTVIIIFIVDKRGRVKNPIVKSAPKDIYKRPALSAVKQWKFEPGKRRGQPVSTRMRVPITFPKK